MRPAASFASYVLVAAQAIVLGSFARPAMAAPAAVADAGQKGPYEVGFTSWVVTDPSRPGDGVVFENRPVTVFVWYPVDPGTITASSPEAMYPLDPPYGHLPAYPASAWAPYGFDRAYQEPAPSARGPFPLLVLSPGWTGAAWSQMPLATRLASHGIVVAVTGHVFDSIWEWEPALDMPGLLTHHILGVVSYHRPRDMSFALSDLLAKNATPGHLLEGTIHPDQIAAGGHSLGGYAAITLVTGDDSVCDTLYGYDLYDPPDWTCTPTPADPRIKALVTLDPSSWIMHFSEMARVQIPVLALNQEWNSLTAQVALGMVPPQWQSWGARPHAAYSGRPSYRVELLGSSHGTFGDGCNTARFVTDNGLAESVFEMPHDWDWVAFACDPIPGIQPIPSAVANRIIAQYAVAFVKTVLAGDRGYQAMLTPGWALTHEPYIELFVAEPRSPHSIADDWPSWFTYFIHQPGSAQARGVTEPTERMLIPRHRLPF